MKSTNFLQKYRGGYTLTRAFTLIELLVVIAIIGILAAVVIASLNSARTKGRHASIKANLRNAVSQSNIYFNENGTYTGLCSDPTIVSILSALGGTGNAACFTPDMNVNTTAIVDIDWGIATTFDGAHFTADPSGVLQLDQVNTGSMQTWDSAMAACAGAGKRLPGGSSLKALYDITGVSPSNFTVDRYWSYVVDPTNTANAYGVRMSNGSIGSNPKTENIRYVRCGN